LNEIYQIPLNKLGCRLCEGESIFTNDHNDKYKKFNILEKCFDIIFQIITIPSIDTEFYGFHMLEYSIKKNM